MSLVRPGAYGVVLRLADPMILPRYSCLLAGLLPDARLKVYPDSAHGFLFQHHAQFAAEVHAFLSEAD
jgi:pimeloyl-ACP methyl ester carboxylesterase